jgi:hypothetical protein
MKDTIGMSLPSPRSAVSSSAQQHDHVEARHHDPPPDQIAGLTLVMVKVNTQVVGAATQRADIPAVQLGPVPQHQPHG